MDKCFTSYLIEDRSFIAFVKREIHNQLLHGRFSKKRIAETDIVISELTSNLLKHAKGGELLFKFSDPNDTVQLEVVTIDNGPGMTDIPRMMRDGMSTSKTLGQGLGAIHRLSNRFQVYSIPNWGTVTYTLILEDGTVQKVPSNVDVRALCVPMKNETVSGDGYGIKRTRDHVKVFMADGLGHGKNAHEATLAAHEFFRNCEEVDPVEIIRQMHSHVRRTRGLVASVGTLDLNKKEWRICGVGNISTRLYGGMLFKHYTAYNGIIGLNIPGSMNDTVVPAERNQQLIMCSDGIRTRWDLTKYPSILKYDAMMLAASIYKDFTRRSDDASVFVGKVTF